MRPGCPASTTSPACRSRRWSCRSPCGSIRRRGDPRFWPDPERFDPGRWAEGGGAPPHRYSYLPFGAGTRKCIGATFASVEGALLLAVIARRARLEAVSDRPLELLPQITLRPRGAVPMRVSPPDRLPSRELPPLDLEADDAA